MPPVNVPAGSLIIPMDTSYQNLGMFKAYGLVDRLLRVGIPVMWAIQPGKAYNGTDFVASATDFQTGSAIVNHSYSGGPFIIDQSHRAAADPIIAAWQASNATAVHVLTAPNPLAAPIFATMTRAPRIAVEQTNANIVFGYLNAAGIRDANGNAWSGSSPGVLSATDIGNGALVGYSTAACRRRSYDIFYSPHTSDATWISPSAQSALDDFVKTGGYIHSMCHSISAIENIFFFLTTGIPAFPNKGDTGTFTVDVPDYGLDQAVGTTKPQALPGGSEQTWLRSAVTYLTYTRTMAHFLHSGAQYDFMITGPYKGGTGAGTVTYEGGHSYTTSVPYLNNADGPYLRFALNSELLSVALPHIDVILTPNPAQAGVLQTITATVFNDGGQTASNLDISITPIAGATNITVSTPPTTAGPPTWTWTGLTAAPGTVLTMTFDVTPSIGYNNLLSFTSSYKTPDGTGYGLSACSALTAIEGALPSIVKSPAAQGAFPNTKPSWTITASNTSTTISLDNVVITDTIPAGLTYDAAGTSPTPTSVVAGPAGTTIVTWQAPDIPSSIPAPGSLATTLSVLTPPATSAGFVNTVTLTGTDTKGNQFNLSTTAVLEVTDRPPVVTVTNPLTGDEVSGTVPITWTASDPDGDPLTYDVYYSPDCGTTWLLLATGLTATTFDWNTAGLNGSEFHVRVIASDGLLTGQDEQGPFAIDNTPPTVQITAPPAGSTLCGDVTLEANAADNVGVTQVIWEYSTDGGTTWHSIGTAIGGNPWAQVFETTLVADGPIQIRATAYDAQGNHASDTRSYIVDNTPPTAAIVSPPSGSEVQGTVTVVGSATDNIAVTKVEWYIDGTLVLTQTAPPYHLIWDTTMYIEGPHTVSLVAYDGCPHTATATADYVVNNIPDHAVEVGIDHDIVIPPQKPPAEAILDHIVQVQFTRVVVIPTPDGTKVIILGVVHVIVKYVATDEEQSVHVVEAEIPFETFILWPGLPPGASVDVAAIIEAAIFKLVDPRTISKYIVLLVTAQA